MAPPKQPPKTQDEARASNNSLVTDFFKRGIPCRPKKRDTLASDDLDVHRAANSSAKNQAPYNPSQAKPSQKHQYR
jgi:hypothetical protein